MNRCTVCSIYAENSCANCKNVYYCSRRHQKLHWSEHKHECAPIKIAHNDLIGRHFIATRDIAEAKIILRETPIVIGPKTVSSPICLGCHKKININNSFRCKSCQWPMCNRKCSQSAQHIEECQLMVEKNYKCDIKLIDKSTNELYGFIVPLRCLLLKDIDKKKYDALMNLEAHLKEILSSPLASIYSEKVVPFFKNTLKLNYDKNTILTICGILHTNAFEVRSGSDIIIRGVYPKTSMLAHNCIPNTKHTFYGDNHEMVLISTVPIKKGEIITTTYTHSLWGTLERKIHLTISKFFNCKCKRCASINELGTYMGSIYCTKCFKSNNNTNPKMININQLDINSDWKCEQCDYKMINKLVKFGNKSIKEEITKLAKNDPIPYENFLKKYEDLLHPTNSFILQVKYALVQMYGNVNKYKLNEMSTDQLTRKIDLCQELLDVGAIIEPGSSRFRGILLYDRQEAMVIKAKKEFANDFITLENTKDIISQCLLLLKEAAEILKTEPDFKDIIREKIDILNKELS